MTELKKHEQRLIWNRERNRLKMISIDEKGIIEFSKALKRELSPGLELLVWNYGGWIMITATGSKWPQGYSEYHGWLHRRVEVHNRNLYLDSGMSGSHMFIPGVYKLTGDVMNILGVDWLCFGPMDAEMRVSIAEDFVPTVVVNHDCDMVFDTQTAIMCGLMGCRYVIFGEDDNGNQCFTPVSNFEADIPEDLQKCLVRPFFREYDRNVLIYEVVKYDIAPGSYKPIFGNFEDGRPWIRLDRLDLDL